MKNNYRKQIVRGKTMTEATSTSETTSSLTSENGTNSSRVCE